MSEFETDYEIEINNEEDAEKVLSVFREMDKALSSLERRRHSNNFAKKIERYEAVLKEDTEEIKKLNLPKESYIAGVKGIMYYNMLIGRVTPLSSIGLAERELYLLINYMNDAKKVWPIYKKYLVKKYCSDIDMSDNKE